jgi:hypothetical protein
VFKDSWLRIYYTPLADPDLIAGNQLPGYHDLTAAFTALRFPIRDLDDGWAIMGYDALATVVTALKYLQGAVTGPAIQAQIQNTMGQDSRTPAPGADGPVTFDGSGNRVGDGPGLVRLCPSGAASDPLSTVRATSGTCPAG